MLGQFAFCFAVWPRTLIPRLRWSLPYARRVLQQLMLKSELVDERHGWETQDVRALRVTQGSQRLLVPAELSLCDNSPCFVTSLWLVLTFPSSSNGITQGAATLVTLHAATSVPAPTQDRHVQKCLASRSSGFHCWICRFTPASMKSCSPWELLVPCVSRTCVVVTCFRHSFTEHLWSRGASAPRNVPPFPISRSFR